MSSEESKYHHLLPRTYMKPWCFSNDTIYVYDKSTKVQKPRNIENICGKNYFHSIRAGSLYNPSNAINSIWEFLLPYDIQVNGLNINTVDDMNRYYIEFDNWEIRYPNGQLINKRDKNIIHQKIAQKVDNEIEKQWNIQFENDWGGVSSFLYATINDIHQGNEKYLTVQMAQTIMKYLVMFDWRGASSNAQFCDALKAIDNVLKLSEIELPMKKRVYPYDRTAFDEIQHAFLLKTYNEFFTMKGAMYEALNLYNDRLSFVFVLANSINKFITSDNPSFMYVKENGYNQNVFVVLPDLLILTVRKDTEYPLMYKIRTANDDEIARYNKIIYNNCNLVLSSTPINPYEYDEVEQ